MISGILSISLAFIAAAVSTAAYWLYYQEKDERFLRLANTGFSFMGIGVIIASALLYFNIFTHNFQLNYVYSYTSSQLSTYYLISTFWAGQEGTFLLWLVFATVYGMILISTVTRQKPLVMFYFMLVNLFLLLILMKKSPFAYIWHTHAEVPVGFTPADGAGLNPLLENPWMIIHPPVMFIGYSATAVGFAMALNAMTIRDFYGWIRDARPWVIFSTLMLGAGIILGGYWSYVTLGWGGYWAWDPVENASLVPWLFTAVLLHGLIIQQRQRGLVRTNLFLAGMSFIAVLWGSFLTRSGVLGDFSVHSFAETDLNLYLVAFVTFFAGLFLYLFFKTFRYMEGNKFAEGLFSRETFILIGMLTLLFTGIIVFIATSSPIYTRLLGQPSNVSTSFYNTISQPVAIFLLLSMALAPLLAWKVARLREWNVILVSAGLALVITVVAVLLGMNQPMSVLLTFLALFTIFTNGWVIFRYLRKVPVKAGAYLAHAGLAFMIIGIITSSWYDTSEKVTLPAGEFVRTRFGYEVEFVNFVRKPDGKDRVKLLVKQGNRVYEAEPQFYYSDYTKSYMISPHVQVGLKKDIYISPISFMPAKFGNSRKISLTHGETQTIDNLIITFNRFIVGEHSTSAPMTVKAELTVSVTGEDGAHEYTLQPAMWYENGKLQSDRVDIPGTPYKVQIESLDASSHRVNLVLHAPAPGQQEPRDILAIEVSEKPLISVLWIGSILLLLGIAVSLLDRNVHPEE